MAQITHHEIFILLISLAVLLGAARVLGELAQRFQQPSVLGEILAGILLGPTVLGALAPSFQTTLFPATGAVAVSLQALTTIAITLFLMVAGMEVDLSTVWKQGRAALVVGTVGIVFPFALTFVLAWIAPTLLGAEPSSDRLVFALFLATAMSITALPVIAKILLDLNLFHSDLGVTIVAAAILNDLVGWIIFALVLAMMHGPASAAMPVWQTCLLTIAFAILMLTVVRWSVHRSLPWIDANTTWPAGVMGFALTMTLLCAALTEIIGIHAIFGAFLFGIAIGDSTHLRNHTRTTINHFVSFVFAPLFFASIGLRVDFLRNFDVALVAIVLVVAAVGKVAGCTIAARWSGFPRREAQAIGVGMNARGAMEIILGLLALQAGIIGDRLFVALVVMALVTSMTSGMLIQRLFRQPRAVRFIDYVTGATFFPDLHLNDKFEAIAMLARAAAEAVGADCERAVREALQRERLVTSAMGRGIAVPHARLEGLKQPSIAVGLLGTNIDFDPPDGRPVRVVLLVLTPQEAIGVHLSLLKDISRVFLRDEMIGMVQDARSLTELRAAVKVASTATHP